MSMLAVRRNTANAYCALHITGNAEKAINYTASVGKKTL
jgi:hypothetical protein